MCDKNLYAVPLTIIFTDGTALDSQVVILAEDEANAKAATASWLSNARPWQASRNDTREIQRSDLGEPEELKTFCGYGVGTKALFWEMHSVGAKTVQSA